MRPGIADWLRFAAFALVAGVVYAGTLEAGYTVDYLGWYERVRAGGFAGAWSAYDYAARLEGYALLMWATVRLAAWSPLLVYGLAVGLYASAAASLAQFAETLFRAERVPRSGLYATVAGLLWLLSPVNTELIVVRVAPHYSVSALAWCAALLAAWGYLRTGARRYLLTAVGVHALSSFFLEFAYVLPLALVGLTAYARLRFGHGVGTGRPWGLLGASILVVAGHLLLTRVTLGAWIGHYGAEVATAQPISETLAGPWRYLGRHLLLSRSWSWELRSGFNAWLASTPSLLLTYGAAAVAAFAALLTWRRGRDEAHPAWQLAVWLWLAGCGAAAVSQLYYFDLLSVHTDRMGALTGLFAAGGFAFACALLPRLLGLTLAGLALGGSVLLLREPLQLWRLNATLAERGVASLAREAAGHTGPVYLIGYPSTAGGSWLFLDLDPHRAGLGTHADILHPEVAPRGPVYEIAQYNQQALTDSVSASWRDGHLHVSLHAPGAWWQRDDRGLTPYRNTVAGYRLEMHDWHFEVHFDRPPPRDAVFLYQRGPALRRLPYPAPGSPQPKDSQ